MGTEVGARIARVGSCGLAIGVLVIALAPPRAHAKRNGCPAGMASVLGRFCIDRYEASTDVINSKGRVVRRHSPYHRPSEGQLVRARSRPGAVPQAHFSQLEASAACEAAGKRLCTDDEWVRACKGRRPTLYPYGETHVAGRCNDDGVSPLRALHGNDNSTKAFGIEAMNDPKLNQQKNTVARTGSHSRCRNSFGLYDMVGNLHEWTANPAGVFRGGYYLDTVEHGKGCSYKTNGHDTKYHDYSIGFRCCSGGKNDAAVRQQRAKVKKREAERRARHATTYVVENGDTLGKIAKRFGTTVDALCNLNDVSPVDVIRPGQVLRVPGRR